MVYTIDIATRAYMAGIIDGEGCLSIRKRVHKTIAKNPQIYTYYVPIIELGMCDEKPIQIFSSIFGHATNYEHRINGNRPVFCWRVVGRFVIPVLMAVLPYLLTKQDQAFLLIEYAKTIGNRGHKIVDRKAYEAIGKSFFDRVYSCNHFFE